MKFLSELEFGLMEWLIALSVCLVGLLVYGALSLRQAPPTPEAPTAAASAPISLPTSTEPPTATVLPRAQDTATPEPTQAVLAIAPTATWFYIAPHQLEFAPTPDLPPAAPFPTACDGPGRMNILMVGIDGFDSNYLRAARSDTLILVGVNFANKTAQMLSIPRDLWVALPGIARPMEARINTAYHYGELYGAAGGGPGELKAVIENTFGLRVDRYVVVSFTAFEQGVDAIGGIEIDVPEPIHDSAYPMRSQPGTMAIDFPAGQVQMDGGTALIYARIRHDSDDFKRMRRQQQVLYAVRAKLLSPETIPHLPALAQILYSSVRTDLTLEDIGLLGCAGPQIDRSAITAWTLDSRTVTPDTLPDGAQILRPNLDAMQPVLQSFNAGE